MFIIDLNLVAPKIKINYCRKNQLISIQLKNFYIFVARIIEYKLIVVHESHAYVNLYNENDIFISLIKW